MDYMKSSDQELDSDQAPQMGWGDRDWRSDIRVGMGSNNSSD